jgi:hypothetical protein
MKLCGLTSLIMCSILHKDQHGTMKEPNAATVHSFVLGRILACLCHTAWVKSSQIEPKLPESIHRWGLIYYSSSQFQRVKGCWMKYVKFRLSGMSRVESQKLSNKRRSFILNASGENLRSRHVNAICARDSRWRVTDACERSLRYLGASRQNRAIAARWTSII